ncbi:MAG: tetratricopeptide repeat protein, partial [Bacteroidetes bacterium]|nr:tetratricopeptide repeat protein [Bacteroidota bacterium]
MRQLLITSFILFSLYSVSQSKYVQAEELYEKAMTSYKQRSLPEAEQFIEQSLFLNPMAESYYLSGLIYEALGEEMKALSAYEATIKFDPAYQEAIFQKALIYLKVGDTEKALSDFNLLLENHDNIETHGVYFQVDPTGNSQNKVLSLVNLKGQLYHYRGQAYQQLEQYDEALRDYTNALKTDTAADYYISRALLRAELGDDSLATLDLNAALAIEPKNQLAWYNLALLNPAIDPP